MTRAIVALMLIVTTGSANTADRVEHLATITAAPSATRTTAPHIVRTTPRLKRVARTIKRKPARKVVAPRPLYQLATFVRETIYLPSARCWNGEIVIDHPDRKDCPPKPEPVIPRIWRALVQCEANGDWRYGGPGGHTDAGYREFEGGPNFVHSTWTAFGGRQFAEHAWGATPMQQVLVARRVLADQGRMAWPVCGPRVGLARGD